MKTLLLAAAGLALLATVSLSPAMAQGPQPLRRKQLARHPPTRRSQCFDWCRGSPALRVAIRLRQTRALEGSLGVGQVTGD